MKTLTGRCKTPPVPWLIHKYGGNKMAAQGSSCAEKSQPLGADSCLASNVLKIQLLAGTLACHPCSMETCKYGYQ